MSTRATIAETVKSAALKLDACSESPRLDAEILLSTLLGLTRSALIARADEALESDKQRAYADLIRQRADGTPVAYLTGHREFWSLPLRVSPAVLIPRPETETLLEQALALLPRDEARAVLDLGTGSGAIALALAHERPRWSITAVDLSAAALAVARHNAQSLQLSRIRWRLGSWFDAVPGERFHLIAANPPYVSAADPALQSLSAEPLVALRAGPTGLEALTAIIAQAPEYLHDHGWLALEHGLTQAPQVAQLLQRHGFTSIRTFPDFSGRPRVTLGVHTQQGTSMIRFETTLGDFTIELFEKDAPESVANFTRYIDEGFFDGTIFHRIVPGFVIQGGGFTEDMTQKKTKAPVKNEADNGLKNKRGTLSMARTNDINSATSQFFVNLKDNDFLDHSRGNFGYAVFAKVTEGMDVVDKIAAVETGRKRGFDDVPVEAVTMKSVRRVKP
jgi:release factor glutamine methyltransferase